jgi:hypothetical protein
MPKGSSPSATMNQKYNTKLDQNIRELAKEIRLRRTLVKALWGDDAAQDYAEKKKGDQRVVSQKYAKNDAFIRKYEKSLLRRGMK